MSANRRSMPHMGNQPGPSNFNPLTSMQNYGN